MGGLRLKGASWRGSLHAALAHCAAGKDTAMHLGGLPVLDGSTEASRDSQQRKSLLVTSGVPPMVLCWARHRIQKGPCSSGEPNLCIVFCWARRLLQEGVCIGGEFARGTCEALG